MKRQQSGFTLIELIMVIVILGILSAFALPKFADLSTDAERAAAEGARAAIKSAAAIAHAAWLLNDGGSDVVTLEGVSYTMVNGYPSSEDIDVLAGITDFTVVDTSATVVTISKASCTFTYTEAASVGPAPAITALSGSPCTD